MRDNQDEFDFVEGKRRGKEGMDKAYGAKRSHEWLHDVGLHFMSLAIGDELTADSVAKRCGVPDEPEKGRERNHAVGSWFNSMAKAKFIKWTGKMYKSERVSRHASDNKVWVKIKG